MLIHTIRLIRVPFWLGLRDVAVYDKIPRIPEALYNSETIRYFNICE